MTFGFEATHSTIIDRTKIYLQLDKPYTCIPFSMYTGKEKVGIDEEDVILID